ncbi:MAG: S8 family serine peptidase [Caldilineaceae bacterium]|nr:S8 family serine peptidase [Caldilineaceae bacterium]
MNVRTHHANPQDRIAKVCLRAGRFRLPIVACFVALLLNGALLLGMIGGGSWGRSGSDSIFFGGPGRAQAAMAGDDDCNDDWHEDCEDEGGDNGDPRNRKWEGAIISLPVSPTLTGTWIISISKNERLTVTATIDTRFKEKERADFVVGQWIEVKGRRQADGSILAERIRIDDYEAGEIVVRLAEGSTAADIAERYGLTTTALLTTANIYLFATAEDDEQASVDEVKDDPAVIWAEVNYVQSVPEEDGYKTWGWGGISEPEEYAGQSAFQQVRLKPAGWSYRGEGVVVAVLDTGVYTPHEQFKGKLLLPGLDVISDDDDPSEIGPGLAWGHGTHVAGVIAAMAPAAKILPVRVLDENGRGNTFLLAYAIEWASQQPGVKVINLSLGTEFDSVILRSVIAETMAQGIVIVAAAGNNGSEQIQYPAGYPDVIGVTALDHGMHKATFANFGEGWVDIAAPGVGIMSTMVNEQGPGYATWSGTSMATAFVSGAAVLVMGKMHTEATTPLGVANQLVATGLELDSLNPDYQGKIGRLLDVSAALDVTDLLMFMPQVFR